MVSRLILPLALLASFSTACASAPKYSADPLKIPVEEFRAKVKTIAVASVVDASGVSDTDHASAAFCSLIEKGLRDSGIAPVPNADVSPVQKRALEAAGGLFDPNTGKLDDAKADTVLAAIRHEVHDRFQADAIVLPRLVVRKANFNGEYAAWDNVRQSILPPDAGILQKMSVGQLYGTVATMSLILRIEDPEGRLLFENGAGVQVLARYVSGSFQSIQKSDAFANPQDNAAAVELALEPLRPAKK